MSRRTLQYRRRYAGEHDPLTQILNAHGTNNGIMRPVYIGDNNQGKPVFKPRSAHAPIKVNKAARLAAHVKDLKSAQSSGKAENDRRGAR